MLLIEIYIIQPTPPYPERVNIFHIYYQAVPVRVPPIAPVIVVSLQTT